MDDGLRNLLAEMSRLAVPKPKKDDDQDDAEMSSLDGEVRASTFEAWVHGAVLQPDDYNSV